MDLMEKKQATDKGKTHGKNAGQYTSKRIYLFIVPVKTLFNFT